MASFQTAFAQIPRLLAFGTLACTHRTPLPRLQPQMCPQSPRSLRYIFMPFTLRYFREDLLRTSLFV